MDGAAEDAVSLLSTKSVSAPPDTIDKLVMRMRALTFTLLPVEVSPESISEPMSRIVTAEVIKVYQEAAGDFGEALPYALLRARQMFVKDAARNAADFDENIGRATACEVLARRIVHLIDPERLMSVMSTRYRYIAGDGQPSNPSSALEIAIDQHCTIFLSSSESQHVVNALWKGDWVQINNKDGDIDYISYHEVKDHSVLGRLDPSRLGVPRYQNVFRVAVWLFFLGVYSQAVRQPLERLDPTHNFDVFEGFLYSMALAFSLEEMHKLYVTLRYFSWRAFGFWTVISLLTDSLLVTAFTFRIAGIIVTDNDKSDHYHLLSFQFLACVAPFIWMKLITVVENYKWIGTMTICIARMLRESVIFFALLSVLLAGFVQGMYALDVSDRRSDTGASVINILLEGLLQAPDFDKPNGGAFGQVMFYLWMLATTVILLNILISLFSSAYEDVVDNAEAQYLAFFAGKTINMIRAPDTYVYPAPFNLIEGFLVAPFELIVSPKTYAKINRFVMSALFFAPLTTIALFEASMHKRGPRFVREWIHSLEATDEDDGEAYADPVVDHPDGLQISKVAFKDLVKRLPNTAQSTETVLTTEIRELKSMMQDVLKRLDSKA